MSKRADAVKAALIVALSIWVIRNEHSNWWIVAAIIAAILYD
jgi:hypothetical protein